MEQARGGAGRSSAGVFPSARSWLTAASTRPTVRRDTPNSRAICRCACPCCQRCTMS
jgi:hypothetical protein